MDRALGARLLPDHGSADDDPVPHGARAVVVVGARENAAVDLRVPLDGFLDGRVARGVRPHEAREARAQPVAPRGADGHAEAREDRRLRRRPREQKLEKVLHRKDCVLLGEVKPVVGRHHHVHRVLVERVRAHRAGKHLGVRGVGPLVGDGLVHRARDPATALVGRGLLALLGAVDADATGAAPARGPLVAALARQWHLIRLLLLVAIGRRWHRWRHPRPAGRNEKARVTSRLLFAPHRRALAPHPDRDRHSCQA